MEPQSGLCRGCYRTLDEIAGWIGLSADERRVLLAELARRRARHGAAIAARCLADAQR